MPKYCATHERTYISDECLYCEEKGLQPNTQKQELTDEQIMLIIKTSLDHNAYIIQWASFIYGQEFKHHSRERLRKDFVKAWDRYNEVIENILEFKEEDK